VLGDAVFNRCVSSFAWWNVFGTGLGLGGGGHSAPGSVRVGVTEIDVNRTYELLSSMHQETIFIQTFQNYFHGDVTCSQPFIKKNSFLCKLLVNPI
jgi:hypothetical protein